MPSLLARPKTRRLGPLTTLRLQSQNFFRPQFN